MYKIYLDYSTSHFDVHISRMREPLKWIFIFSDISPDTVSLLPSIQDSLTVKDNNGIFNFDGKSVAFEIPALKFAGKLESKFTVSTWLRHEQSTADSEEEKQHILCNADGEGIYFVVFAILLFGLLFILWIYQNFGNFLSSQTILLLLLLCTFLRAS